MTLRTRPSACLFHRRRWQTNMRLRARRRLADFIQPFLDTLEEYTGCKMMLLYGHLVASPDGVGSSCSRFVRFIIEDERH